MSFLDKFKETSKNKKILIAVIAVLVVGGGTTVGILVHNNSDKPSKAEVSSVDDNITAEVDDTTENENTSSDDEAETTNNENETESVTTTTASEESTENTETEVINPSSSEEVTAGTENSQERVEEPETQQPVYTQAPVVTQPTVQTTTKPVQTTVATTKAPVVTTTVATQPAVDESNSITRNGYYGHAWSFWNGNTAYCWVTSSRIVRYDFNTNTLAYDYELVGQEYTDFMYVYNNEIACGSYPASAVSKAFKYITNIASLGRDRVLYTNDIEDDGICSSVWSVWITSDGEYWWTA